MDFSADNDYAVFPEQPRTEIVLAPDPYGYRLVVRRAKRVEIRPQ